MRQPGRCPDQRQGEEDRADDVARVPARRGQHRDRVDRGEEDQRQPGAPVRSPQRSRDRQHNQRQDQARHQVAGVGEEAGRRALLPGRGQRGEDVDEGGGERRHRDHAQDRVARAPGDVDGSRNGDDQDQRPERAEGVVELGEEPSAVDRRLAEVVGDGEARPRVERHLVGPRQVQRPEANRRDRVAAGLDHRPHVPVAADHEGREAEHPGRGQAPAAAAEDDHAETDRDHRDQEGELDRGRETGGDAGDHQRPLVEQRRALLGGVLHRSLARRPSAGGR